MALIEVMSHNAANTSHQVLFVSLLSLDTIQTEPNMQRIKCKLKWEKYDAGVHR